MALTCGLQSRAAIAQDDGSFAPDVDQPFPEQNSQPLWEVGLAAGIGAFPDYPAADHERFRGIPVPYFIYRGEFLRSDDDGTRLRAKFSPTVELEFSGGGSLSSPSSSNGPRSGMPNLDYLLELGPSLKITAAKPSENTRVIIDVPVRGVISTNFSSRFGWRGLVFGPDLALEYRPSSSEIGWGGRVSLGAEIASTGVQKYFYQVDSQYALPDRPAFDAHGGYLGSDLELSVYRSLTAHFRIYLSAGLDLYTGARNQDSPLFQTDTGWSAGFGFTWSLWQSRQTVITPSSSPR